MINGIKPKVSVKARLDGVNETKFDRSMNNLLDRLTSDALEYIEGFNHITDVVFKTDGGRKFIKVKYYETTLHNGNPITDKKGRIHCFVDKTTGDIYKPQTWRAPYTKGNNAVRGNIYNPDTYQKTDIHGGWLYHSSMRSK